jgi:hypothetical protein
MNTDVVLFGFDGFVYFGNLQAVEDCRIAILTPAIHAETSDVEILTPGGELVVVSFVRVDLWQIVGKATGVTEDPVVKCDSSSRDDEASVGESGRQESHNLIHELKRMIGDNVSITTLGGFLFEGILTDVRCELAILKVCDIFVPGKSRSISDSEVRGAVVNLEAVTSVGTAASCRT